MLRLIVPDLDHTEEIDLGAENYRREIEFFSARLEEVRAAGKEPDRVKTLEGLVADMRLQEADYLGASNAEHIYATIGYLPAPVISAIRQRLAVAGHKAGELGTGTTEAGEVVYESGADADRQTVRWGLRAWRGPGLDAIVQEQESVHGRKRPVAPWEAVDAIERAGLLKTLSACVWEFNELSAQKKTRSSGAPGSTETCSTVGTAVLPPTATLT